MDDIKTELGIVPVESHRPGSLLYTDNKPVVNELIEKYGQTQRGLKPRKMEPCMSITQKVPLRSFSDGGLSLSMRLPPCQVLHRQSPCCCNICSSRDPRLISAVTDGSLGAATSPWVTGIQNLRIGGLSHFINTLILVSGLSYGNAYLFAASRTLYGLARGKPNPLLIETYQTSNKALRSSIPQDLNKMHKDWSPNLLLGGYLLNLLRYLSYCFQLCHRSLLLVRKPDHHRFRRLILLYAAYIHWILRRS